MAGSQTDPTSQHDSVAQFADDTHVALEDHASAHQPLTQEDDRVSYLRIRVRPVAPAIRTAYCRPRRDRRNSVPPVQLPSGEKLAMSLAPNRTASADPGSSS